MNCDKNDLLLYAVTDRHWLDGRRLIDVVRESLDGGVTMVQLREKTLEVGKFLEEAKELQTLCRERGVPFLVNDNVEIAREMNADGVHVGQSDMEAQDVRAILGPDKILGVSAQTVEQAVLAEKHGADNYVIRMTGGKVDVLPINANETVYHFDEDDNLTTSGDKISTADLVTRVKVIGLEKKTKKRSVEATLDGKTEYGIRQRIYTRSSDDTAAQAKSAAQKTLDEKGEPTRKTTLKGADLPFIRKGDKIRAAARTVNGFCTVLGVQHDAANRTMTMTVKVLGEDSAESKKGSDEYKVGDVVNFAGGSHYKTATDTQAASTNLSPGKAK